MIFQGCSVKGVGKMADDYMEAQEIKKIKCPLCDVGLDSLYHTEDHKQSGFHYRCPGCLHGWYIADLKGVVSSRLLGKTDEEIREIILKQDGICPECGEIREDDGRVKAGMKCSYCAYGYPVDTGGK